MMNPQVSVIMPAFNTGRWIRQAIQSALDQTLTEVEILVVEDPSTGATAHTAKRIHNKSAVLASVGHPRSLRCQPREAVRIVGGNRPWE